MAAEEAFAVAWPQLPQRDVFTPSDDARRRRAAPPNPPSRSFRPTPAAAPHAAQRGGWEYLDHTADVQIHSWGLDLAEAFGAAVVAMSAYMVELPEIQSHLDADIHVHAHDEQSLLFNLMDECLYIFHTEQFVTKQLIIRSLDTFTYQISATVRGGNFDASRHSQGTEVKAITYSNMQILKKPNQVHTYVIVDI